MRSSLLAIAATLSLSLAATPAQAQQADTDTIDRLIERVDALEAETRRLRDELAAERAQGAAPLTVVEAEPKPEPKPASVAPPAISNFSKSDGFTFKPRGRLQFDIAGVNAPDAIEAGDDSLGVTTEVRRARLGASGDIPGGFGYKFELDFADASVAFADAYLDYGAGPLGITLGHHNNFQSLEEITSSNDISFMERAAFTDAFGFERRLGLSAGYGVGDLLVSGGVFTSSIDDLSDDGNQAYSFDGRAVYMPQLGDTQLHLGGSIHWRDLDEDATSVRYRQRPFVHTTDVRLINTGSFDAESELSYGLEAAAIMGRFHAASEAHWLTPESLVGEDPTFFGGYAELGYFLTPGYSRGYSSGKFKGVEADNGWNGIGAIQANIRYDHLDLGDETILGGTQNAYAASLVWSPQAYLRFILNAARIDYRDAAVAAPGDADYSVDVVGARAQVAF